MATASAIEPAWMTDLFRPTNRLRDLIRELHGHDSYELSNGVTEVELLPDLSPEHVLATLDITWEEFCRFVGHDKFVWMGLGVYVSHGHCNYHPGYRFLVELRSKNSRLHVYAATNPEPETAAVTTATCDFVVRLLATSQEDDAFIEGRVPFNSVPISGPSLSRFFQESHANLRKVTLKDMILNEEQIGALATTDFRPDMQVILRECSLSDDNGCHAAFVECLHRDRGPTVMDCCVIGYRVLAAALEGNRCVTRLVLPWATLDAEKGAIFRSLAENKGLLELDLHHRSISDANWTILCQSLKVHPTLTSLELRDTNPSSLEDDGEDQIEMSIEQRAQRTRLLAAMVQENRVLLTIALTDNERDDQIYMEMIHPYLEMNLYRPRVLGIKKAEIALRRALLGRALQTESVRNKSNLLWMLLSGNQDVVVQSIE
jgi:hypothetical protein